MKKLVNQIKDTLSIFHSSKGFTLLELLVVVLIVGILAGIALPQYRSVVGKAELVQVISTLKAINNAQDRYYLVHNEYATDISGLDIDWQDDNRITCFIDSGSWVSCYGRNYAFVHYYSQSSSTNRVECYSKNKKLSKPCEDFLHSTANSVNKNLCNRLGTNPCWVVSKIMPM